MFEYWKPIKLDESSIIGPFRLIIVMLLLELLSPSTKIKLGELNSFEAENIAANANKNRKNANNTANVLVK